MGITYTIESMPDSYKKEIGGFDLAFRIRAGSDSREFKGYMDQVKYYEDICQWCCKHFLEHFVITEKTSTRIVAGGHMNNKNSYTHIEYAFNKQKGSFSWWGQPSIKYYELRCYAKDALFFKMVWG